MAIDFDGVLHPYTAGWTGPVPEDEAPTPGALEFLRGLIGDGGYRAVVFSTRCDTAEGVVGVSEWLTKHNLIGFISDITCNKPAAVAYVDDRAVPFAGNWYDVRRDINALAEGRPSGAPAGTNHDHDAQLAHLIDEWGLSGVLAKLLDPLEAEDAGQVYEAYRTRRLRPEGVVEESPDAPPIAFENVEASVREAMPELAAILDRRLEDVTFTLGGVSGLCCSRCGVAVQDSDVHRQWHRDLTFGIHAAAWTAVQIDQSVTERLAAGFRELAAAIREEAEAV